MANFDRLGDPCAVRVGASMSERLEVPRFDQAPERTPIEHPSSGYEHPAITALKSRLSDAVYAAGRAAGHSLETR